MPAKKPTLPSTGPALFSPCGTYRYTLERHFTDGVEGRTVVFVMLNPSTADEQKNDPTVRRCVGFAHNWRASKLVVVNLFALRSTDPRGLERAHESGVDPVGPDNNEAIVGVAREASTVVCAWGRHGAFLERGYRVRKMLRSVGVELNFLKLTEDGVPYHPLYLPARLVPQRWEP